MDGLCFSVFIIFAFTVQTIPPEMLLFSALLVFPPLSGSVFKVQTSDNCFYIECHWLIELTQLLGD